MNTVKTANGIREIVPVYCEWTGKQLCWATVPECPIMEGATPAYLSFKVVDTDGKVLMDLSD